MSAVRGVAGGRSKMNRSREYPHLMAWEPDRTWVQGEAFPYSQSQIRRVGDRLRLAFERGERFTDEDLSLLNLYRSWHQPTLERCQRNLVSLFHNVLELKPEQVYISGRPLKTVDAIVAKISRNRTRLNRMQDIAGTRIVVPTVRFQDVVSDVVLTMFKEQAGHIAKDTCGHGDDYGYRAIHVVATLDGRFAEIQIRTVAQDAWAQIVEQTDKSLGSDLKHGRGPADWVEWLLELSEAFRQRDLGKPASIPPTPHDRLIESLEESSE